MTKTCYTILLLLLPFCAGAQQFFEVIGMGTGTFGGNNVTATAGAVPPGGVAVSFKYVDCLDTAYRMGQNGTKNSVTFSFSQPIDRIRLQVYAGDSGEALSFVVNTVPKAITKSCLSTWLGPCVANTNGAVSTDSVINGNFVVIRARPKSSIIPGKDNSQIDILCPITTSVTISHPTASGANAGLGFHFYFANDTFPYINPAFKNNAFCQGSTFDLPYLVTHVHSLGNVFTAQLSDITGSFANPVNIGSVTAINAGTIKCIIPLATPVGTGYRIRIVSTKPPRISEDNGYDITIGPGQANPKATANTPLCEGQDLILDASGGGSMSYSWTGPAISGAINQQTVTIPNAKTTMSGTYIVTIGTPGCLYQATVAVQVNPVPPKPTLTANDPVCELGTLKITAATGMSNVIYDWLGPNGVNTSGNPLTINNVTSAYAGNYEVVARIGTCKSPSASTVVSVIAAPPKPDATANTPICEGEDLNLQGTSSLAGASYSWTGPNNFKSSSKDTTIKNTPRNATGSYILEMKGANNCANWDTVKVVVNKIPDRPRITTDSVICDGYMLQLTAQSDTGASFIWRGPNGYTASGVKPEKQVSYDDSGWYFAAATLKGCTSAEDSIFIHIKFSPPPPTASSNTPVHEFDSLILYGGNIYPGSTWFWVGPDSFYSTLQSPTIRDMSGDEKGTYVFSLVYDGCTTSTIALVDVIESDDKRFVLYPNPNNGNFTVEGHLKLAKQFMPIAIYNELGMVVYLDEAISLKKKVKKGFSIGPTLANAVYYFVIRVDGANRTIPFVLIR